MRSLTLYSFVLSLMTTLAAPALAVTPQTGDVIIMDMGQSRILLQDADTDEISIVSCWNVSDCGPLIGTGPIPSGGDDAEIGPDGYVYFFDSSGFFRVDLKTGNREIVVDSAPGWGPFTVYPAPSFFPATVASIGGWGVAVLVAGIFIGVQLRIRRTADA